MAKRIVVCCDGTWNKADQKHPTNVLKFLAALDQQSSGLEAKYVPGVGTSAGRIEKWLGGAFGFGLSNRVREAYEFIAAKFEPGDQIYLLGFSRGAYTARSTAGLIRNIGVLKRIDSAEPLDPDLLDQAFKIYRNRKDERKEPDGEDAQTFRNKHSHTTDIRFIGVWDTVGALGIPLGGFRLLNFVNRRWQFHDTKLSSTVRAAFQALAIDERRRPFRPALWKLSRSTAGTPGQVVEQVWFSGVHCNIGGGYEQTGLSDITLQWMAHKAHEHGLQFQPGTLGGLTGAVQVKAGDEPIPVIPWWEGKIRNSRTSFYRLTPPLIRPIGLSKSLTTEWAASTAELRLDDADYRAPNLVEYLNRRNGRTASISDIGSPQWPDLSAA